MRSFLPFLAAATLSLAILPAQTGTFTTYGKGCQGSAASGCISANWNQAFNGNIGASTIFALPVNTGSAVRLICGFELFCKTKGGNTVNMNVWIHDKASTGLPGKILGASTMQVTGTAKANRATFSTPIILNANVDFFLAFDNSVNLNLPIMKAGTTVSHYHSGPNWRGPYSSLPWNYSIICCGGGTVPKISSTGVPTINQSFSVDLSGALPNANTFFALGTVKANIDLTIIGAPTCTLLTNPLVILGFKTSSSGTFSLKLTLPNAPPLVGFVFYTQYAVNDPINAAKLVTTAGGEGKVGK